jgi:pyruvate kinase
MNVARLNFSHGNLEAHAEDIRRIRAAADELGQPVAVMADLPGPKIRLGALAVEPTLLKKGERVTLTVRDVPGNGRLIPVAYPELPRSVARGGAIYINDGAILLKVQEVTDDTVTCRVVIGGPILSHKGVNLPGAHLSPEPVSAHELALVDFGLAHGIDIFSVSFVEKADDIMKVKEFARSKGREVFTIAKIERAQAVADIDALLAVTDGLMIARGDLGVEMPIEEIPMVQKRLIRKANAACRPVITATQMLLSMTDNTRPTRAESTDVANAILDGSDAVMLSEETAIGKYPVETVRMMARIATSAERHRRDVPQEAAGERARRGAGHPEISEVISRSAVETADALKARYILTPTRTGATARRVARSRPDAWILSFCETPHLRDFLLFSYGVVPFILPQTEDDWYRTITTFLKNSGRARTGDVAVLTQGRYSPRHQTTDSIAVVTLP